MFELAEESLIGEAISLTDQIDTISTRLIIDGVRTLEAADFEQFAHSAKQLGNKQLVGAAEELSRCLTKSANLAVPELTRILSSGLVELRRLLDNPEEDRTTLTMVTLQSEPTAAVTGASSTAANPLAADGDLIREFVTESREHLLNIEAQMLLLEKDGTSTETLNSVFRAFHTIKGLAGFLEFGLIQSLAHEVETLLDLARTSQLEVTPAVVDLMLESTDIVRHEIAGIELTLAGKTPPPSGINEVLLQSIRNVAGGSGVSAVRPIKKLAIPVIVAGEATTGAEPVSPIAVAQVTTLPEAGPPSVATPAAEYAGQERRRETTKKSDSVSIRINTGKLDQLMDMVGEMVIAQTLIGQSPVLALVKDAHFLRDLTQLARITTDVQRIATGMRMVPIGLQFQKTARLVRDLSRKAGKQIVLDTSGEDTEVDKTIAEELSDPLLHMVRNSIDHGIETPEERIALGKDPTAHIRVSAYHQSGQIVVAISDDGRGLSCEKILAKACANGLVQSGAQLTENEIFLLIFEAGFSTAEKVTDISGRGVGMDVVRKHVQKLRGRIEIHSKPGQGTTFYLKLPLTLAIIDGLVVEVGGQRYIVPIFSVKELLRPTSEMLSTVQGKGEMAMVREKLLPIVRLHRRFNVEPRNSNLSDGVLIVVESEGRQFCLFVDDLVGKQEVVIKSLGQSFEHISGVAGCAILGDGRVGLILDIDSILKGRVQ
jgi:two-component system chemotaxis sensor kinase CheA